MKKGRIVSFSIFMLSFGVVLGGWYLTRALLEQRREEFLGRTGEILMQSSETALLSAEMSEDAAGEAEETVSFQGEMLSEDMMAKVLAVWESGGRELPHEPKRGQMNMEQAIEAGKEWIAAMAEQGIFPPEIAEGKFDYVSARLCTLEAQVDFDENLISYWSLQFIADEAEVSLTIHAMSGDVWQARIVMEDHAELPSVYKPDSLLEIAFPFIRNESEVMVLLTDNTTIEPLPQRLVYASVKEFSLVESGKKPIVQMEFRLSNA